MSSVRERQQRAAARAKLEREMAARAAAAHRRRRLQAGIGAAVAVLLVLGGTIWLVASLGSGGKKASTAASATPSAAAAPGTCTWLPDDPKANPSLKNVGTPPGTGNPHAGTQDMAIATNRGTIKVTLDVAKAPCASASFSYLAGKKFFDNTTCHRLVTSGIYVLQCGDPTGTGMGGPTYKYAEENLPTGKSPAYPAGTLAMAKTSAPSTTGSQFFIVYKDTELPADYTVVGKVTSGLDVVQKVAAAGAVDTSGKAATDGAPKDKLTITSLRVGPVVGGSAATSPSATG